MKFVLNDTFAILTVIAVVVVTVVNIHSPPSGL